MAKVLEGDLEFKTIAPAYSTRASTAPKVQTKGETGVVEFLAAVTGVVDDVGDVIVPGAFTRTLRTRRPKVCLNHAWDRPIGRTLEVKELLPGDPDLPATTVSGAPWPREAGALKVKAAYNLATPDGFASFKNAQFFPPEECQFSIGYKARKTRRANGIRFIHDLDLYEYGPVLHAANSLAGLLSIKDIHPDGYETTDVVSYWDDPELEGKARYVRDSAWWGLPLGTLIRPGMKPRGRAALAARKQGKTPSPNVGVSTERPHTAPKTTPAKRTAEENEGSLFGAPEPGAERVRASRHARGDDDAFLWQAVNNEFDVRDPYRDEKQGEYNNGLLGLLNEGITPAELAEDLAEARTEDDDELTPERRQEILDDYAGMYRERARQQAAGTWTDDQKAKPPKGFTRPEPETPPAAPPPPATEPVLVRAAGTPSPGYAIPPPPRRQTAMRRDRGDDGGVQPQAPQGAAVDSETTRIAAMSKQQAARAAVRMSDEELAAHEAELTSRASQMGRAGQVSGPHQALREELGRRNGQRGNDSERGSNATRLVGDTGDNQESAQRAGDDDGAARDGDRGALPEVPADDLRGDWGQDGVLRGAGARGGAADRGPDRRAGGSAVRGRGDLPGADGADDLGPQQRGVRRAEGAAAAGGERRPDGDAGSGGPGAGRGAQGVRAGEGGVRADGEQPGPVDEADAKPADTAQVTAVPAGGQRFKPSGPQDLAPAGTRAKLNANMAALRTLRELQNSNRPATPEQQRTLARWSGWGAVPQVFDKTKPEFAKERDELAELLSEAEYRAAARTTLNAHYTDARVVDEIWNAVERLGFDGGRVLEPGSGSGTFIGFAPESADMVGVELDSTTAAISRYLYPDANVRNESFADTALPSGAFDLTVGNVPYGDYALTDKTYNADGESIHNHFILKSLELTRPGGLVAVLTSRYTLDSKKDRARRKMAELGDLVGAVRLPTGSHAKTAGTDAIEDLVIFRRREPGQPPQADQSWITSSDQDIDGETIRVSDYFTQHPENVLGEISVGSSEYGPTMTVLGDKDMGELPGVLDRLVAQAYTDGLTAAPREGEARPELINPDAARHEGHIQAEPDGTFTQAVGGAAYAFDVPKSQAPELGDLIGLRDALSALLDAESKSREDTPDITALRTELNARYDRYVTKFGPINRFSLTKTGSRQRPGQGGFRKDPMSAIVRALEDYDATSGTATKADIFTKRAVAPREIATKADNPQDALTLSMDTYGEVNLPAIADMLGVDEQEARAQLGDLVFEQPPLTEAEVQGAYKVDAMLRATPNLAGGVDIEDAPGLETVGESVRQAGRLEPAAGYLSGNVRKKLAVARAAAAGDPRFAANVDALEKVVPRELGPDEIDGRLGAAWIDSGTVQEFLAELVRDRYATVKNVGTYWTVESTKSGNLATEVWGTRRRSAGELIQSMLEQRPIKVGDTTEDGKNIPNLEETLAAQAKAEEIQERFSEWLWEDPERARRLQGRYNDQFNAIALRSYDGAKRTFPGMAAGWSPRPHQTAAVERIVSEPTALLGHVVGAGKTAEMTMGTAELKRLGLARKPAIIVPNHMLEQFSREYLEIYPQARILAAGTDDLQGDKRREFVARAATGDWDAVILTQNAFESIPMSAGATSKYIDNELAEMRQQLEDAKAQAFASGDKALDKSVKKMEKAILRAEEALKKKFEKAKDVGVTFEQTGIDYLMVDEAHGYSNLRTLSNIQGAGASGSGKATDLHMKLEYLRENSQSGRVATFATGTPIRNTVTQAFVMMRFLRPDLLKEAGISSFDAWAATFGQVVEEMELKPEGAGFRTSSRFAKFRNVPELLRIFHTFSDIKLAEDLDLPTPNLTGGKVETVTVPSSDALRAFIADLGDRAELVRNGSVEPEDDNMLKISTDGRKAALSMALVGQDHEPGKIESAADRISTIWRNNKDKQYPIDPKNPDAGMDPTPGAMQIVFMDMGTPTAEGWNGYDALRAELVARGMDPAGIRFIHEAKNDQQKAEMFAAARAGKISVLIGSSEKMGVGTNVQRRAVALHHLDAPWRPADVEQRDGRIMRQGNLNPDVEIIRYVTEGSFDAYMWQTLERKAKFINQIMKGSLDVREIEDVGDTAMSYAEVKALATGNPDLLDKAKIDTLLTKLERLNRTHQRTQSNMRTDIVKFGAAAKQSDVNAADYDKAIAQRDRTKGAEFAMRVAGRGSFDSRTEAADELKDRLQQVMREDRWSPGKERVVGTLRGFDLTSEYLRGTTRGDVLILRLAGVPGEIARLNDNDLRSTNAVARVENFLGAFEARREASIERAANMRLEVERMQDRIGQEFPQAAKLDAARRKSTRLAEKMQRDAARDKGAEIPFDPKIDSDQFDDPILGRPDADVPPETPPAPPPVEELAPEDTAAAEELRQELAAGTVDVEDLAAADELADEMAGREIGVADTTAADELAEDVRTGQITAPAPAPEPEAVPVSPLGATGLDEAEIREQYRREVAPLLEGTPRRTPATEPAAAAAVEPSLEAGDPVPAFGKVTDALAYIAGRDNMDARTEVAEYASQWATKATRTATYDKLLKRGPHVLDGATVLAVTTTRDGVDLGFAREQLQRLRDKDATHPVVAMRTGDKVTLHGLRKGSGQELEPVDLTGQITHVVPVRFGVGAGQKRMGFSVRITEDDGADHYVFLERDTTVVPVAAVAPSRRRTRAAATPSQPAAPLGPTDLDEQEIRERYRRQTTAPAAPAAAEPEPAAAPEPEPAAAEDRAARRVVVRAEVEAGRAISSIAARTDVVAAADQAVSDGNPDRALYLLGDWMPVSDYEGSGRGDINARYVLADQMRGLRGDRSEDMLPRVEEIVRRFEHSADAQQTAQALVAYSEDLRERAAQDDPLGVLLGDLDIETRVTTKLDDIADELATRAGVRVVRARPRSGADLQSEPRPELDAVFDVANIKGRPRELVEAYALASTAAQASAAFGAVRRAAPPSVLPRVAAIRRIQLTGEGGPDRMRALVARSPSSQDLPMNAPRVKLPDGSVIAIHKRTMMPDGRIMLRGRAEGMVGSQMIASSDATDYRLGRMVVEPDAVIDADGTVGVAEPLPEQLQEPRTIPTEDQTELTPEDLAELDSIAAAAQAPADVAPEEPAAEPEAPAAEAPPVAPPQTPAAQAPPAAAPARPEQPAAEPAAEVTPEPEAEEPVVPAPRAATPEETELSAEDIAEIEDIGLDAFGLIEAEDGELEVTEDVADRQDRVEALLDRADAGKFDVAAEETENLTSARTDIAEELRLQTELRRRDRARRAEQRPDETSPAAQPPETGDVAAEPVAEPAGEGGEQADTGVVGEPAEAVPVAPRPRPGLAGAAEDYAEALRGDDAAAIERTRLRLESSLRRSKSESPAVDELRRYIADTGDHDPDRIVEMVAAIREQLRVKRNEAARRRRTARRLERERLRSLLGQIDAELRNRNLEPNDYGGDVAALLEEIAREATNAAVSAVTPPVAVT